MANIKITVNGPLMDGHKVTFKAPSACVSVEYLDVRYVKDNAQASKLFTMKDAHGNTLTGIGNLFEEGAYVHVILDTARGFAYLQNADTNKYIEDNKIDYTDVVDNLSSTSTNVPLSANQGRALKAQLDDFAQMSVSGLNQNEYIDFRYWTRAGVVMFVINTYPHQNLTANTEYELGSMDAASVPPYAILQTLKGSKTIDVRVKISTAGKVVFEPCTDISTSTGVNIMFTYLSTYKTNALVYEE